MLIFQIKTYTFDTLFELVASQEKDIIYIIFLEKMIGNTQLFTSKIIQEFITNSL